MSRNYHEDVKKYVFVSYAIPYGSRSWWHMHNNNSTLQNWARAHLVLSCSTGCQILCVARTAKGHVRDVTDVLALRPPPTPLDHLPSSTCLTIFTSRKYLAGCGSSGLFLMIQVFVNVGGVVGLLPITGVTLPFLSFGGSSLLANALAMGILLNIGRQSR